MVALTVPGYNDAALVVPVGATAPRPIVVAVHGNYDRPEWQCEVWRAITSGSAFVLCPRGIVRPDAPRSEDRWTYGWNGRDLEREINAGLTALKRAYEPYVDPGPMIYGGFSLGAILGADIVLWNPSRFSRAVLIEGGTTNWSLASAKAFARAGGQRVLFACGQPDCVRDTRTGLHWLQTAGVAARTASGGAIGHTYDGPVADAIVNSWSWLTEGDPRWIGAATSWDGDPEVDSDQSSRIKDGS
jgi:predicted esterase